MSTEVISVVEDAYKRLAKEQIQAEKVELLNWVMRLCNSGMTTGMVRLAAYNKIIELQGGEKA